MSTTMPPYDLNQGHTHSPFVTFETAKSRDSWPWHAVQSIGLNAAKTQLVIEFPHHSVEILGANLDILETEARSTRLKTVREASGAGITIRTVRVIGR